MVSLGLLFLLNGPALHPLGCPTACTADLGPCSPAHMCALKQTPITGFYGLPGQHVGSWLVAVVLEEASVHGSGCLRGGE